MFLMVSIGYVGFPQYERIWNVAQNYYCKSSIKPHGGGGLIHFKPMGGGGLIWEWGFFNLEKTMASVLQNELEYEVEKLKYTSVSGAFSNRKHSLFHITVFSERSQGRGHAAEDQNQIRTFSW